MTEINQKNRKAYLDLCETVWDMDKESMDYIAKRTSDEWKPIKEFESLVSLPNTTYEDQRVRIDMDMANPLIQSFFEKNDQSFEMFKNTFFNVIDYLDEHYNCKIGYKEFIDNKVVFKKNQTKIKKVFELAYAENTRLFARDSDNDYTKEECATWIVKKFERIGASKKSAKKLQFVISFNPIDWMMASTAEDWSSCFNINNQAGGYQYCLGLPFLCGDKNRMLLYITDGSKKNCLDMEVDHFQTRTWCLADESGIFNIVKWYPNDTIGVEPVISMTNDNRFKNRDSFKKSKYPLDVLSTKKGAVIGVYSDMGRLKEINNELWIIGNSKDGQQVFTKNLIDCGEHSYSSFKFNSVHTAGLNIPSIGYRIPEWKKFGVHVDAMFPTLRCKSCHEDKTGFSISNGFLCYDCYKDKVFVCKQCGQQHFTDEGVYEVITTTGETVKICSDCYSEIENRTCDCCDKYSLSRLRRTTDGTKICDTCLEAGVNGYATCDSCNSISKNIYIRYNTFSKERRSCCEDCSDTSDLRISTFGRYMTILKGKSGGSVE